jgi:hypothetical protein
MHKLARTFSLALGLALAAPTALAQQQQWAAAYINWTIPSSPAEVTILDQDIAVLNPGVASFFTLNWEFVGAEGGYIGLQSDEAGVTNARFSLWNATTARGEACRPFDGEGVGMTCVVPLQIEPGVLYRVEVIRGDRDAGGQWWSGWISQQGPDGAHTRQSIGAIQVQASSTRVDPDTLYNFSEFWGNAVRACRDVPLSSAVFVAPGVAGFNAAAGVRGAAPVGTRPDGHPCARGTERTGAVATHQALTVRHKPAMVMVLGGTTAASTAAAADAVTRWARR